MLKLTMISFGAEQMVRNVIGIKVLKYVVKRATTRNVSVAKNFNDHQNTLSAKIER